MILFQNGTLLHVAGTVTADDFSSGTKAEIAGGTTSVIDFGTAYPGETLNEGLDNWFRKAEAGCSCDYGFHQTITEWNDSISAEIPDMIERGASTFKIYMTYDTQIDDCTILKVLQRLKECGTTTGCHCENSGLIDALRVPLSHTPGGSGGGGHRTLLPSGGGGGRAGHRRPPDLPGGA